MTDFARALAGLEQQSLLRRRRVVSGPQGPALDVDGRRLVAFASNDYLGLASHPAIAEAAIASIRRNGVGASASHLISGHHAEHAQLEAELAAFVGLPKALYFASGYMANTGVLPALVGRGDAVFSDALNHACIIDGARLSRAEVHVYPHADLDVLEAALRANRSPGKVIVSDAVFSMDGDVAPIAGLADLAERHDAWLLLDDAHGFGVLGPHGQGTLVHLGIRSERVLYMATLGKAAGVSGAFVAGAADAIDWLVQRARTYVFTTATPPLLAAAVSASLRLIRADGWRRDRIREHAALLRARSAAWPWRLLPSATAIQPLIVGANAATMQLADRLIDLGFWAPGIRPPTVPEGTGRLRICVTAGHERAHVEALADALSVVAGERSASAAGMPASVPVASIVE